MNKKFLISGFASGLVILVIMLFVSTILQSMFNYNVLELGGMRNKTDPIMALFFIHPWVLGFALSYIYIFIIKKEENRKESKNTKDINRAYLKNGTDFGILMWIAVSIPNVFLVFSSMDYPIGFTVNSLIGSLFYMVAAGITIAWIQND